MGTVAGCPSTGILFLDTSSSVEPNEAQRRHLHCLTCSAVRRKKERLTLLCGFRESWKRSQRQGGGGNQLGATATESK